MRETLRRLVPLALLVSLCAPLSAQQEGLRDRSRTFAAALKIANDLQSARFHKGPFYILSIIELSDIGYNQQFFIPTHDESSGLSLTVDAPQRFYFVPRKKTIYSLELTPSYSLATGGKARNQLGYLARADAQYLFNHLYLDVYALTANRLGSNSGELNRIYTLKEVTYGADGEYKYSSRTSATFGVQGHDYHHPAQRLQPEDINIQLYDRKDRDYRATFVHKTFPLTSLRLVGEVASYQFPNDRREDSRRAFFGAGFSRDNGKLFLTGEAGAGRLDFKEPQVHDFRGLLGNLSMSERASYHWTISARASRDADFSLRQANNGYYLLDRGAFTLEYSATRRLTLRALVEGGWDRYDLPAVNPHGLLLRRLDSIGFYALGWNYTQRRARYGFDLGYFDRNSNFSVDEQHGIRLILHLSYVL